MAFTANVSGIVATPTVGVVSAQSTVLNDFQQLLYVNDLNSVFFNTAEFAITISYYHSSLSEWTNYQAIFDDPHTSFSMGANVDFNTLRPQLQLYESALKHRILKRDLCIVNSVQYHIDDFVSDGVGVTTCFLRIK